jgi:hypothetical protein
VIRFEVGENFGAAGGENIFRIDQVLERNRNAMERSPPLPCGDFGLGLFRRFARERIRDRDVSANRVVGLFDSAESTSE